MIVMASRLLMRRRMNFEHLRFVQIRVQRLFMLSSSVMASVASHTTSGERQSVNLRVQGQRLLFCMVRRLTFFIRKLPVNSSHSIFTRAHSTLVEIQARRKMSPSFPLQGSALGRGLVLPFRVMMRTSEHRLVHVSHRICQGRLVVLFYYYGFYYYRVGRSVRPW